MKAVENRIAKAENRLPKDKPLPCVSYACRADRSDEQVSRAAAVAKWETENKKKIDPDRVQFICWRIFKTREEVARYGK